MKIPAIPTTYADRPADRLIRLGCVLLLLPLCVVFLGALYFVSPLAVTVLPRGSRPVIEARQDETLILITHFTGQSGDNPTAQIDQALLDINDSGYFYQVRTEWLNARPDHSADARRLAEEYGAALLFWGTYDSSEYTVNFEILQPFDIF